MSDLVILNGSPRQAGNSSFLAARAEAAVAAAGAGCRRFDLARLRIGACTACDLCRDGKVRYCAQRDDMDEIYAALASCRALLLVSPVYWFSYSAQLKLCVDRFYGLWNRDQGFLAGKPAGAVLVYGDVDAEASGAVNAIGSFGHLFRFLGADDRGVAHGTAGDPGDAERDPALLGRVLSLVQELLDAPAGAPRAAGKPRAAG